MTFSHSSTEKVISVMGDNVEHPLDAIGIFSFETGLITHGNNEPSAFSDITACFGGKPVI